MNIIQTAKDPHLFKNYLGGIAPNLHTWSNSLTMLKCIYGIKNRKRKALELIRICTGRDPEKLSPDGYSTALLLIGRRGGKSKVAGLIAAFESALSGKEEVLSPGERALCSVISPTKLQSQIVKSYIRSAMSSPMLEQEIVQEDATGFELSNGVRIQILTGCFKSVRGFTQICTIVEEAAFFCISEESRVKNAAELINSIRPGLLTTGGKCIVISTKYRKVGWCWKTHKKYFANDDAKKTLVWEAPSILMNPTLDEETIAELVAEDPAAGQAEFLNCWREDLEQFLPIEIIQSCVIAGRKELLPRSGTKYFGFVDCSGGISDDAALGISHLRNEKHVCKDRVVIDCLRRYKSPHSPALVVGQMATVLKKYGLVKVTGDFYSAQWVVDAFKNNGIKYEKSKLNKSQLFLEVLPRLCSPQSGGIELVDDEDMVKQFANLERKTRGGGRDIISHPAGTGYHDDLCNCIAGAAYISSIKQKRVGVWLPNPDIGEMRNARLLSTLY